MGRLPRDEAPKLFLGCSQPPHVAAAAVLGLMALSLMVAAPQSAEDAEGFSHRKLQFTGLELLVLAPLAVNILGPLLNLAVDCVSTLGQEVGAVLGVSA